MLSLASRFQHSPLSGWLCLAKVGAALDLGIYFHDVGFRYPGKGEAALEHVDLKIPHASVFALLGPNGAGKTTLLRILCSRLQGYSGHLSIPAQWQTASGHLDPRHYGVLVEHPGVYARLSVREYLEFFGSFYGIEDLRRQIQHLADLLQFERLQDRMGTLSLGMRQKVQIMRTFLHSPPLVLLDEPTANLDPIARDALWSLVSQANRTQGTTFIVCSHLLGEMEQHCSDIGFLRSGHLSACGSLDAIRKSHQAASRVVIRLAEPLLQPPSISSIPGIDHLQIQASEIHYFCEKPEKLNPLVIAQLVYQGAQIVEMGVHHPSLGEIYRHFVEEKSP